MSEKSNGGRVTTREFYDALLNQNDSRENMERRIMSELKEIKKHGETVANASVKTEGRCNALEDKIDGKGGVNARIEILATDTKANARNIKVVGALEAALLVVCGWVGINK